MTKKADRESTLRLLWLRRPENQRTGNDVFMFSMEIQRERPELLGSPRYGDPYQQMKSTLSGLIREPR